MTVPWAIALDLGGTQIRGALVNAKGELRNRVALQTASHAGADAVIAQLVDAAHSVSGGEKNIVGVGLSSPGPLDTDRGLTLGLPNIAGFENFPLRDALSDKLGRPVALENDGIAAAIGEWQLGAGQGLNSLVYVTVSTGIGGGVIVDGHVLRGRKGMGGHVGHLCIKTGGKRCNCGNLGCWEAYASGPAFAARAREKAATTPLSALHGTGARLTPEAVFAAAEQGDELARKLVEEEAELLGVGITSLLHLYSPERMIVGGGLSNAFAQLHPGIADYVTANAIPAFRDVPVVKAALGGNSGLIGAACLVFSAR